MRKSPISLLCLDAYKVSDIQRILNYADALEGGKDSCANRMNGKILCPIFLQDSSRTYINATTSFIRMGGTALPLNMLNTRLGSGWSEPIRDFCTLINSCCDYVIFRSPTAEELFEFAKWCKVPLINGGNGSGKKSDHPVQALVDLFVIQQNLKHKPIKILMLGGKHIRTTRTQVKLFYRYGFDIDIISPSSPVCNDDMDSFYKENTTEYDNIESVDLSTYDILYHNGMDENPSIKSPENYVITLSKLKETGFTGIIMHSLPRLNELEHAIDDTSYNMYYTQMKKAKYVFQSIYCFLQEINER